MKKCFVSLDEDGGGSIGIEELENPLIGLGFAECKEEIQLMVDEIDKDGSGQIEFDEFLLLLKNTSTSENTAKIKQFFVDLANGNMLTDGVSFNTIVQQIRRAYMMDAVIGQDPFRVEQGKRIMKNVQRQAKRRRRLNVDE